MWNQMCKKRFFKSDLDTWVLQSFPVLVDGIVNQGVWCEQHFLEQVFFQTRTFKYEVCHYTAIKLPDFQMLVTQDCIYSALKVHSIKGNPDWKVTS